MLFLAQEGLGAVPTEGQLQNKASLLLQKGKRTTWQFWAIEQINPNHKILPVAVTCL